MARIKINFPDKNIFETELELRISDINYGGHLGNDSVLSLVHEARIRFLNSMGYSEIDIEGAGIIMTDAAIVYKAEGFHADKIKIQIFVTDFSNLGFDMLYKLIRIPDNKEIARAKTGIVFFNYKLKKISPMPDMFLEKLKR